MKSNQRNSNNGPLEQQPGYLPLEQQQVTGQALIQRKTGILSSHILELIQQQMSLT